MEHEGIIKRVIGGKPHVAWITVQVLPATGAPTVTVACAGRGGSGSQGDLDDVSADGYDTWKAAAVRGVWYGLISAQAAPSAVRITRIIGRDLTDTNPIIVGVGAVRAIWGALGYTLTAQQERQLMALLAASWATPEALPVFEPAAPPDPGGAAPPVSS